MNCKFAAALLLCAAGMCAGQQSVNANNGPLPPKGCTMATEHIVNQDCLDNLPKQGWTVETWPFSCTIGAEFVDPDGTQYTCAWEGKTAPPKGTLRWVKKRVDAIRAAGGDDIAIIPEKWVTLDSTVKSAFVLDFPAIKKTRKDHTVFKHCKAASDEAACKKDPFSCAVVNCIEEPVTYFTCVDPSLPKGLALVVAEDQSQAWCVSPNIKP